MNTAFPIVHSALRAMLEAFDVGQDAGPTSAIAKARDAVLAADRLPVPIIIDVDGAEASVVLDAVIRLRNSNRLDLAELRINDPSECSCVGVDCGQLVWRARRDRVAVLINEIEMGAAIYPDRPVLGDASARVAAKLKAEIGGVA